MPRASNPKACPVCRKPQSEEHSPFCSQGCRNRDLLKWLDEGYRIPGPVAPDRVDTDESDD